MTDLELLFKQIDETFKQAFECVGSLKKDCNDIKQRKEKKLKDFKEVKEYEINILNQQIENDNKLDELLFKQKLLQLKKDKILSKKKAIYDKKILREFMELELT